MKSLVILCVMASCAAASQLVVPAPVAYRAPSHDSAIIQSHRLGGNFAYSTNEAHAYAVQTPVIGQRVVPVGVSYHQGVPKVTSTTNYITHQIPQFAAVHHQIAAVPQVATYGAVGAIPATYGAVGAIPNAAFPYPYAYGPAIVAPAAAAAEEPVIDTTTA